MKFIRFILFSLLSNSSFVTLPHEGKDLREIIHFARKYVKGMKESLQDFSATLRRLVGYNTGSINLGGDFLDSTKTV
jgi:hypothetical protein